MSSQIKAFRLLGQLVGGKAVLHFLEFTAVSGHITLSSIIPGGIFLAKQKGLFQLTSDPNMDFSFP